MKGTNIGTTTDFDGNYQLSANTGDLLVFSYVGFSTQEILFKGEGTKRTTAEDGPPGRGRIDWYEAKEDLTGSVDVVSSKQFNKGAIVSTDQLLQKAAGVV